MVPGGRRYFCVSAASSLRYQPDRSTALPVVFRTSTQSDEFPAVWARISLITTLGDTSAGLSSMPGVPSGARLARQLEARPHVLVGAAGSRRTSVLPGPSVVGCQASL